MLTKPNPILVLIVSTLILPAVYSADERVDFAREVLPVLSNKEHWAPGTMHVHDLNYD